METTPAQIHLPAADEAAPVTLRIGRVRWRVRSAAVAEALRELLRAPDAPLQRKEALIHDTWLVSVARVSLPIAPGGRALLRRSSYAKRDAQWRDVFRTAGPLRAFRNGLALERAGIATPRVLAAGVIRSFRLPKAGYLLVEEIVPATTLAKLAQQPGSIPPKVIHQVAEMIVRMHEQGFIHGDLTINNVLLDQHLQPWFIDLERGRRCWGPVSWRQAVEDFHRFARHVGKFGKPAQLAAFRLLKHYCQLRGWAGREREFAESLRRRLAHKIAAERGAE
jgi:tRNA A-37 threonylcarbamoyl transferase component Bud32